MQELNSTEKQEVKKEVNTQLHTHLSTIFIVVGIVSFSFGIVVNYLTIRIQMPELINPALNDCERSKVFNIYFFILIIMIVNK